MFESVRLSYSCTSEPDLYENFSQLQITCLSIHSLVQNHSFIGKLPILDLFMIYIKKNTHFELLKIQISCKINHQKSCYAARTNFQIN